MRASRQRSWPLLLAIAGSMLVVGGVLLVLMRGAFRVGETMIASVEDTRPLGRKPRANEARVRATEHVEPPVEAAAPLSSEAELAPVTADENALATVTVSGRVVLPAGLPADEQVEVRLRTLDEYGAIVCGRIVDAGGAFRLETQRSARAARLELVARYLYVEESPRISLEQSVADLTLAAKLGGCIHGRVISSGGDEELASLRGSEVGLLRMDPPSDGPAVRPRYARARLERDGTFEFRGVTPDVSHSLQPETPSIESPSRALIGVAPGQTLEVELRHSVHIVANGRVVDVAGSPIAGVQCRASLPAPDAPSEAYEVAWSTTNEHGRFSLRIDDESDLVLTATKAGFLCARLPLPRGSNRTDLELRLRPSTPLSGRVTWPNGTPAHGVRVCADDEELTNAPSALSITDEDGEFELTNLADGPFTLTARVQRASDGLDDLGQSDGIAGAGSRFATAVMTHVQRTNGKLELVLAGDVAVRGRVLDERDQPWKRVRVVARPIIGQAEHGDAGREIASSFDATDGSFELRGLHAGEWEVSASFAALVSTPQRVTLGRTDAEIVLRFERGLCTRGFVVDASGALVPHAQVILWEGGSLDASHVRRARCDERGNFQFERVAPGPIELGALHAPDGESSVVKLEASPTASLEHVDLHLRASGTIRGDVVDSAGKPVANARIEWFDDESADADADSTRARWRAVFSRRDREARSGEDGAFTSGRLVSGQYLVRARCEARLSRTLVVEVRENKASRIHITLEDGITVEARMPKVYGVSFHALDARGHLAGNVTPLYDGRESRARLLLPPGSYRIVARASGGREAWANLELEPRASQPVALELAFQPSATARKR